MIFLKLGWFTPCFREKGPTKNKIDLFDMFEIHPHPHTHTHTYAGTHTQMQSQKARPESWGGVYLRTPIISYFIFTTSKVLPGFIGFVNMSTEAETPNVYEYIRTKNNCRRGWLVPVGATLIAAVCFAAGFVSGYYTGPSTGKI